MIKIKKRMIVFLSGIIILSLHVPANARLYEQLPLHAKALSLANAVTANPPGHMAIHYNPAGLSLLGEGVLYSQGFSFAGVKREDQFKGNPTVSFSNRWDASDDPVSGASNSGHDRRAIFPWLGHVDLPFSIAPIPISFSYRNPGSKWTFAYAIYGPESWSYKHESDDPARFQGKVYYQQHLIYASPSVSCQLSERFSMGLSIALGQSALGMKSDLRMVNKFMADTLDLGGTSSTAGDPSINAFDNIAEMDLALRDDFAPSINIGLLWKPLNRLTLGISYQSPIIRRLKGDYEIVYTDEFIKVIKGLSGSLTDFQRIVSSLNPSGQKGTVLINNYYHPQQAHLGVKFEPNEKLRMLIDVHWQNWASIDEQVFDFSDNVELFSLFNYQQKGENNKLQYNRSFEDVFNWSIGCEYQMKESMCLRLGYERRSYAGEDKYFDLFSYPDSNLIGAGLGIKLKNSVSIDLGAGYLFSDTYHIEEGSSQNLNQTQNPLNNPYPGQSYSTSIDAYILSFNIAMPIDVFTQNMNAYIHRFIH
jgi:long-subunit fatty acid transport protein